jgi:hypothetical protein
LVRGGLKLERRFFHKKKGMLLDQMVVKWEASSRRLETDASNLYL